ncbi:AraC family transcriptional regulator [Flagellimonas nanhaiensis]|uniref:Helix-turn-helix domain-containing protein n=1 Tax=Flagellimonas nanhaiensis TaxID=2292706 RepID=A0A371JVA3_9FLAO|nr:helix-turn-helix domain-containing protein [Allomuricauda nanhaiensis]RDY61712.1 helix-turn-helix domain-containing protein [Allomuricauda nanhaiensis]
MDHFKTIESYCRAINISKPKHPNFDIRSFKDNMPTVVHAMRPFRHEFYAIALKATGGGKVISGHHTDFPEGSTIFFNSPFQILSWDIVPDWEGFYIMFSQDFVAKSHFLQDILEHFPFLKIEKDIPFEVEPEDINPILSIYESIQLEYQSEHPDKFQLIESYVLLLLNIVKRYFLKNIAPNDAKDEIRKTDLKILSRFQTLIEISFYDNTKLDNDSALHSTSYYAQKLSIHPNHLNAVSKQITGQTAKQHIQNHILGLAKARLIQTQDSVKEIAYSLYFDSPNNFSSFFKKMTSKTPNSYRKEAIL